MNPPKGIISYDCRGYDSEIDVKSQEDFALQYSDHKSLSNLHYRDSSVDFLQPRQDLYGEDMLQAWKDGLTHFLRCHTLRGVILLQYSGQTPSDKELHHQVHRKLSFGLRSLFRTSSTYVPCNDRDNKQVQPQLPCLLYEGKRGSRTNSFA